MGKRIAIVLTGIAGCLVAYSAYACCPAPPSGKPVVNADQTVILIWDAATKMQHFIRQASFKSDADDFGFLVPSPSRPELAEAGNEAFPYMQKLTEPEIQYRDELRSKAPPTRAVPKAAATEKKEYVKVLEEKLVAGFNASVLETNSTAALVGWLKDNGYAFSPEVEAWAKPYVDAKWNITALKVAKGKNEAAPKTVNAAALRMSFKTDRPLFPYREPDTQSAAEKLGAKRRLLRIYFVGEARYQGDLTKEKPWTGKVAWAGKLGEAHRAKALELLKLPADSGPATWWLTEFEDNWPYEVAPADVYFSKSADQSDVRRPPIVITRYVDEPAQVASSAPDLPAMPMLLAVAGGVIALLVAAVIVFVVIFRGRQKA